MPARARLALVMLVSRVALAAADPLAADATSSPPEAVAAPPARDYTAPMQLRGVLPSSGARVDDVFALATDAKGMPLTTNVTVFQLAAKVLPHLAAQIRAASVVNAPDAGPTTASFSNVALGGCYGARVAPHVAVALASTLTLPTGRGGGDMPDPNVTAANKAAQLARSSFDNSLFSVNDVSVSGGASVAYLRAGWTAQLDANLTELVRVRGAAAQSDTSKTPMTTGVHLGYAIAPWLSVGTELRYQRYLSTPSSVAKDPSLRDETSLAIGARYHAHIGGHWLRPGVAYTRGLEGALGDRHYQIVQIDVAASL